MKTSLTALFLLACAAPAPAQVRRTAPSPPPPLGGQVRLGAAIFDNFFQAADGLPQEDLPAATAAGRVHKGVGRDLVLYGEVDYTNYRRYQPSGGFEAGLRREGRPHTFDVQAAVLLGRPSREVGDEFGRADGVTLSGQYGYRLGDWEPIALAEVRRETYDLEPGKANTVATGGAALRYRGFVVSPEVGFLFSRRDVRDDREDLDQREVYLRLRWAPSPPTYVTLRVRRRFRDYTVDDPAARNFQREDTRTQAVATGDFRTTSRIGFGLYYSVEDSDSTRASGEFLTQTLAGSIVLRF